VNCLRNRFAVTVTDLLASVCKVHPGLEAELCRIGSLNLNLEALSRAPVQ
jgi:hypothetical protein